MVKKFFLAAVIVAGLLVLIFGAVQAAADQACAARVNNNVEKMLECVTLEGVRAHQAVFQAIADANGGTRASGTPGYDASAQYVVDTLTAAGYDVTVQEFDFNFFQELATPEFERISPNPTVYTVGEDFDTMTFSGSGDVTALLTPVDLSIADPAASTSGCEPEDYAGFPAGTIALVQRGTCTFAVKAINAEAAGAVAVVVFNQGTPDRLGMFFGTLGGPVVDIPVISISYTLGIELASVPTTVRVSALTISEVRTTSNVLAETQDGRDDNVVMAGAHLDSVIEGPGIQDNGSGSAALVEIALQMQKVKPWNKVRFAWWGAEELGLVGSLHYVSNLSEEEIEDIALYLNFDMIGSPNFVRFVYDGDSSDTTGSNPPGSDVIEQLFLDYFSALGLPTEPTEIGNRSDHAGFRIVGIPIGGLFTGAEGIKTEEQAAIYGGTAGIAYDPCYHLACDTFDNVNLEALDQNSDAAAMAILTYAMNTETINGLKGKGNFKASEDDFLGPQLIR